MNKTAVQNKLTTDLSQLQRRYNTLAAGIDTKGVDVKAIKAAMENISVKMAEVNRQLELVG